MWLDGNLRMMNQYRGPAANDAVKWNAGFNLTAIVDTEDSNLISMGLTKRVTGASADTYVKTLSRQQTLNAKQAAELNAQGYASKVGGAYSEVQAMQSGILAYAPDDAEYSYLLKEETELSIYFGANDYRNVQVPAGTLVHVGGTPGTAAAFDTNGALNITATETVKSTSSASNSTAFPVVYVQAQRHNDSTTFFTPVNVEYESFTPLTDGLYLFLRTEGDSNQSNPEFSGYYMNGYVSTETDPYSAATFYALNTNTSLANKSDYTVKGATTATYAAPITVTYDSAEKNIISAVPSANLELYNAKYETVAAHDMKFYADAVSGTTQNIYAVYDADDDNTFNGDKDIVVVITIANVGTSPEGWTPIGTTNAATAYTLVPGTTPTTVALDASKLTYYYNNDVEAGDSSAKLVDKVKLYEGVTQKAYLAFDFDLNVHLESIQVTMDDNGNEAATAVASGWAATQESGSDVNTGAAGTQAPATPSGEITSMSWS